MATKHSLLSDIAWLRPRWEGGATVAEIADEAGANLSTVHLWLARHGLPQRKYDIDRVDVERRLAKGQTVAEIAGAYEVDRAIILDRMYRWGLARVSQAVEYDPEQLHDWYVKRGWSIQRIADKLEVSKRTAGRILLAYGIPLRPPGRRKET